MADTDSASAVPSVTSSPKEDAATKSAREDLKHTVISEKTEKADEAGDSELRAATPDLKPGSLRDSFNKEQAAASPKKKRAHDQVDDDDDDTSAAAEGNKKNKDEHDKSNDEADAPESKTTTTTATTATATATATGTTGTTATTTSLSADAPSAEPDKKRPRDDTASAKTATTETKEGKVFGGAPASAFASSGFAKLTSSASPFGALAGAAGAKPSLFGSSTATTTTASSSTPSPFSSFGAPAAKPSTASATATTTTTASSGAVGAAQKVTVPTLSFGSSSAASPFAGLQSAAGSSKVFGSAFGGGGGGGGSGSAAAGSASAFGGLGGAATGTASVFGSALSGPKLTSFAKPGEAFKSDKPARPFGAPESEPEESGDEDSGAEEDENGDDGEGGEVGGETEEKTKASGEEKKKRLQRVVVDDGEAGEATLLQVRARMYYHDKDLGWKERGAGMLKVNVPEQCVEFDRDGNVIAASFDASTLGGAGNSDSEVTKDASGGSGDKNDAAAAPAKPKTATGLASLPRRTMVRLIMRQDSTLRVILNTVVLASTEFKDRQTLKATTVLFTAFEGPDAKPVTVQAKMNIANAKTFLATMEGIQKELRGE